MRSAAPLGLGSNAGQKLAAVGLRTAIDLREPIERANDPVDGLGLEARAVPVFGGGVDVQTPRGLTELYADIIEACGPRFAEATRILAGPDALPGLVFCSAGKDRTGILCALVLSAVGVSDEDVATDFALSADAISGEFRAELEARAMLAGVTEQALAVSMGAPAELMSGLLADIEAARGGAAAYLMGHGLSDGDLGALRRALLA
jgi:protein-tyrosine phosphatase